jgi:hypothetical protein
MTCMGSAESCCSCVGTGCSTVLAQAVALAAALVDVALQHWLEPR